MVPKNTFQIMPPSCTPLAYSIVHILRGSYFMVDKVEVEVQYQEQQATLSLIIIDGDVQALFEEGKDYKVKFIAQQHFCKAAQFCVPCKDRWMRSWSIWKGRTSSPQFAN